MNETRLAIDLRLDTDRPGTVGHATQNLAGGILVLSAIVDAETDPQAHLRILLNGYEAGWALAAHHIATPGGTRHAMRNVAPAGLPERIRAAYTTAFYTGYNDRQELVSAQGVANGPLDPLVFTACEQDAVDVVTGYLL